MILSPFNRVDLQGKQRITSLAQLETNSVCQIGTNRCTKEKKKSGRGRGNEKDVEAAEMTHISVTPYEFPMMLLGLLAHGCGARGDGRCIVCYLG